MRWHEKKRIIPVLYRPCAVPFRLRRMHHIDFTTNRERGFEELLRSLGLRYSGNGEDATELQFQEMEPRAAEHDGSLPPPAFPSPRMAARSSPRTAFSTPGVVRIVILLAIAVIGYLLISVVFQ